MLSEYEEKQYMKKWFSLSEKAAEGGFTWPSLRENDEWCQYMSTGIYRMPAKQFEAIQIATVHVRDIFQRTYEYLREYREGFLKLKFPIETWEVARMEHKNIFSYFTRFDFIVNDYDIKLIEINSDTPTGYLEPSVANKVLCDYHGVSHPNTIEVKLKQTWEQIVEDYNIQSYEKVHFTSYDWHEEDYQTVQFIRKHCPVQSDFVGIQSIIVAKEGLYTPDGTKINYLYRLYPLEYLVDDTDEGGKKIGLQFLDHIAQGRVKIINPPSAFLMQNKAILALIWELYEKNEWFTTKEQQVIEKYFLPTYFSNEPLKNGDYVSKAYFGREGGGVSIINDGTIIEEDITEYYYNQNKVYQKYIEMPDCTIDTWDGDYTGKLLIGSHLIGGEAAGVFLRVGEKITGNLSMFIGVTTD
ncbi:glutathionylspermidine synthase family protein [Bacillus sp. S14(2024)]|uniref:glutathionylspermidine synthase family protein n=1 Tax=Bacillus sp. S14(2024) TaxID=3162884 RepID=UPI003D1EDAC0